MEKILLGLLFLSECLVLSTCLVRRYHFVGQKLTWTEAQKYCREKHTDLATMQNHEEQNQLRNTLSSAGSSSDVWIGLRHEVDWKWSDGFNGTGADYTDWRSGFPIFHSCRWFCVYIVWSSSSYSSSWGDYPCQSRIRFLCYKGSQQNPEYVYVNEAMNWSSAQSYCRENFIDLAIMRNDAEREAAQREIPDAYGVWMGLYRDPTFNWSDGSTFLFENCEAADNPLNSMRVICGVSSSSSGQWKFRSCETRLPFVCYSYDTPGVKKTVVKVKVKVDGSVDLKDPAVQEQLLKQLQDKLKKDGVDGVTLKWKKQKDGEVFHKEDEL
ncbi:secretory phospholipase A2 receptor-like isoform X1 [Cololabis saira]|uniref:secretory phospholipase A2 receptor-like isoform X1 n=1 Tax=Cololabis saira TaxID=129043 RepID=UPI002AD3BDB9|nr:secretory phospholipase A2 receptor-like isoform X1 [Cololabis saira]XP_061576474.1 secretory phospholipase A2 receptor-like isoform X1 [Cololabis saira]